MVNKKNTEMVYFAKCKFFCFELASIYAINNKPIIIHREQITCELQNEWFISYANRTVD